jgi:hypothetical protein
VADEEEPRDLEEEPGGPEEELRTGQCQYQATRHRRILLFMGAL